MRHFAAAAFCAGFVVLYAAQTGMLRAADGDSASKSESPAAEKSASAESVSTASLPPLNKAKTVFLDKKGKRVLLKTKVVLREGLLEMLCCPAQTKEHESILSVDARAYIVHAALIALGVDPGAPVRYEPEFQHPTGPKIEIYLNWVDAKGKRHRERAQSWIRHAVRRYYVAKMSKLPADLTIPKDGELSYDAKHGELLWYGHMTAEQRDELTALSKDADYRKAIARFYDESQPREMKADFVFAGSQFHRDEQTGEEFYAAEGGDLICVANFPSAMIDVSMQSSSTGNQSLLFEPYTDRIPPLDTDVTVELVPVPGKNGKSSSPNDAASK